jgi:hypothetical protein
MQVHPDDRGFFMELARPGADGIASKMLPDGQRQIQISGTLAYPGTIKAIHFHYHQTDLWVPISGMIQVFLCDLRRTKHMSALPPFSARNRGAQPQIDRNSPGLVCFTFFPDLSTRTTLRIGVLSGPN